MNSHLRLAITIGKMNADGQSLSHDLKQESEPRWIQKAGFPGFRIKSGMTETLRILIGVKLRERHKACHSEEGDTKHGL